MSFDNPICILPSEEDYYQLVDDYDVIPVVKRVSATPDPFILYETLRSQDEGFILESGKGGRYSYVGMGESMRFVYHRDGSYEMRLRDEERSGVNLKPFELLRQFFDHFRQYPHPLLKNFSGGGVGLFSYDLARFIEKLPNSTKDDMKLPIIELIVPACFVEIDYEEEETRLVVLSFSTAENSDAFRAMTAQLELLEQQVTVAVKTGVHQEDSSNKDNQDQFHRVDANLSPDEFEKIVSRAIDYIYAGDVFQVNLSVRFAQKFCADPIILYKVLRKINPAPYMAFLDFSGYAIVSSSPELLLKVEGKQLSTRPIAGTRKRGQDEEEDAAKIAELIGSEKERAEHLMLVDLERNDLGRVSEYGSVHVDEFMSIEKYSHVIHIVSNVRGGLADGKDGFDAIEAAFPGGTITGAPKVRAMEIIEELEPHSRGLYTGSVGWIGFNGDTELNIAIRTLVVKDQIAYAQAGAGIVADSVPKHEYKESLRKAEAMFRALQEAERV